MSPAFVSLFASARSFPRVSGDEPRWDLRVGGETEFSPRERG